MAEHRTPAFDRNMDGLIAWLGDNRLPVTLAFFTFGFLMLVFSNLLGNASVTFTGVLKSGFNVLSNAPDTPKSPHIAKEVGYLLALNWSVIGVIMTPLIIWYGIGTLASFDTTLKALDEKGMLRDTNFARISSRETGVLWRHYLRHNRIIFLVVFVCVFAFMMSDWWKTVGWPLIHPSEVRNLISDPSMEYDWSVSSLFRETRINGGVLFGFGLIGYIVLAGIMPAFAFAVVLSALHFVVFVTGGASRKAKFVIAAMPSTEEDDKLCGFSSFYDLFNNLLLTSVAIQFSLWLMSVQNAYLRDVDPAHGNIFAFLLGDVDKAVELVHGHLTFEEFEAWIGHANSAFYPNMQIVLSIMIIPFIIVTAVGMCCYLLRDHAHKARKLSRKHIATLATETGRQRKAVTAALEHMKVWPVAWMKEHDVFILMAVLFVSLLSYRLLLLALIWALIKVFEIVKEQLQKPGESEAD